MVRAAKSVALPTHKRKRVGLCSSYSKHEFRLKKHKLSLDMDMDKDRISKLPDEVIVSILSLLSISEAARTSVLSRRWEKLWTFYTGSLIFDISPKMFLVKYEFRAQERSHFIRMMNHVLPLLGTPGSSALDDFTLRFESDEYSSCHIDRWIEFALGKKIQRLELDMRPYCFPTTDAYLRYTFPTEFYTLIKQPSYYGSSRISALTSLCWKSINVSGDLIEGFLSNCPLLEHLCVVGSRQLFNLKVVGAGAVLKLKYFVMYHCSKLESLEISAPNLISLKYVGLRTKLDIKNVPMLVEAFIGFDVITYMSSSLSSHLSQLETLMCNFEIKDFKEFMLPLELPKLKHLILKVYLTDEASLLGWISLIEACPVLQKFTLELVKDKSKYRRKVRKVTTKHSHQFLKVVELVGFTGCATEVELAMYFFSNATMLETIIIDRRSPLLKGSPKEFVPGRMKAAKKHGLQLKRFLPPGVDLLLI